MTLASDLRVDGAADLRALPAPARPRRDDGGYDVRLDGRPPRTAGEPSDAALHDHAATASPSRPSPTSAPAATSSRCARATSRSCTCTRTSTPTASRSRPTFPTAGRYRLFLQFKHEGKVQTVAFTQEVTRMSTVARCRRSPA